MDEYIEELGFKEVPYDEHKHSYIKFFNTDVNKNEYKFYKLTNKYEFLTLAYCPHEYFNTVVSTNPEYGIGFKIINFTELNILLVNQMRIDL